jgi:hypothetical protein
MEILNSTWFLGMLKKSGRTPRQRLLGMFDILADWLDAPSVRDALTANRPYPHPARDLESFLTQEARSLKVAMPELLAQQLYFIAITALKEEMAQPHCGSLLHAKTAAQALLEAQKQKRISRPHPFAYGLAASMAVGVIAGSLFLLQQTLAAKQPAAVAAMQPQPAPITAGMVASPSQTAELFASLEQMRKGTCYFPEALHLPDSVKTVYIENVVGGQITVNAEEQALMRQLMGIVRCNYTPMLMTNSMS